ncbi:MAG: 2-dehydro-3-deoxygalactonokinase [Paracoccaceae bacterium]|nr:2-dehydro-3-deoxygalactonokinase [Paracoccaceae bacterium]
MSGEAAYCDWVAVDWGTTRLRAWAMRGGSVAAEAVSDKGMNSLEKNEFEAALLQAVEPWLGQGRMRVFASGMVGARQGWAEAPYRAVPCPPLAGPGIAVETADPRLHVTILPGLKQAAPADVMRGEETQIAGYLYQNQGFDGVACLPGTHSKWAEVSAGEVVSFRTFMTGELYDFLAHASVLRHSVGEGWDAAAFEIALSDTLSRPESLGAKLFGIRAEGLLDGLPPAAATARLSGLLIGAELAAARPYWLGRDVVVIGAETVSARYIEALENQGVSAAYANSDEMTRAGLMRASEAFREAAE